jgi:predicted transcriptional regulator
LIFLKSADMAVELTDEQQRVLEESHGFVRGQTFVLLSKDAYRRMMGVESDAELAESLKAIERGLADVDAGRTRPYEDVLNELRS